MLSPSLEQGRGEEESNLVCPDVKREMQQQWIAIQSSLSISTTTDGDSGHSYACGSHYSR